MDWNRHQEFSLKSFEQHYLGFPSHKVSMIHLFFYKGLLKELWYSLFMWTTLWWLVLIKRLSLQSRNYCIQLSTWKILANSLLGVWSTLSRSRHFCRSTQVYSGPDSVSWSHQCNYCWHPMEINVKYRRDEGALLEDPTLYCKLVGSLIYLTITRLDISFVVHTVSKFMQSPQHFLLSAVHRIIRYLLGTSNRGLFFRVGSSPQLQTYSDVD